jgi:hypothetical protein
MRAFASLFCACALARSCRHAYLAGKAVCFGLEQQLSNLERASLARRVQRRVACVVESTHSRGVACKQIFHKIRHALPGGNVQHR